ncbi:MAG TPA: glycoside hydrolase family 97 N-terminal domain-containing protein [Candidatus Paceibacterota bacterium]|nr:glycoside hydrolase family 97 N-terminal domain-containing protein [Verrucomicrobiota bacterium]HRZ46692.1 glycoside hydrolase family 97 N-terminal domain-containing protein [Candidatus Paceibacterota bacterium]HRZ93745.1 glycoside hydrolase family 97 N-terminal domain-containing protein [Candidatus Paceibacterota bacterium]
MTHFLLRIVPILAASIPAIALSAAPESALPRRLGPLRVCAANPRYFADPSGRPVFLTGSHTWQSLQDGILSNYTAVAQPFDYRGYLDLLETNRHNFIRLWRWELTDHEPQPWLRTDPGQALDGGARFDLRRFDPAYFDRLRARVIAARDRGIYVSIMLFEDWIFMNKRKDHPVEKHPFHRDNNVSGIDGDGNGDGWGIEIHTLQSPAVIEVQKAYVRKVIETVNDLDNVLYEICNEGKRHTREWQYEMVRFVKSVEATLPHQHPVGMTSVGDMNEECLKSPADWTSLATTGWDNPKDPWTSNPPPADGQKVCLLDTDHIGWKVFMNDAGFTRAWVWKSFTRGHNALLMENLAGSDGWIAGRAAMGHARRLAERLNLAAMIPHPELASTGYCLADPGKAYVVYMPEGKEAAVDLSAAAGSLDVEWIRAADGTSRQADAVPGGGRRAFRSPFPGDAVLYLHNVPDVSEWTVLSPSRAIRATVMLDEDSGTVSYRVESRGLTVIEPSPLGIATSQGDFTRGMTFASRAAEEVRETYSLPVGKRSTYFNCANELALTFRKDPGAMRIRFRCYDDGIAFRYDLDGSGPVTISRETSGFRLPGSGAVAFWGQEHPNNYGYETMLGRVQSDRISMPVLVELEASKHFLFLAQAASYGTYIVPHFERQDRQLNVCFPLDQEGPVETSLPFQSPWRLAIISPNTLATIVESIMIENLNPPTEPELRNADWIRPGRASWDFLAGDRDKPQTWIDFDVAMGWEYHLVDAGFARRFDVPAATKYAREKNVRIIGWGYTPDLNSPEKAEEILARYAGMGLSGAKLDFFDHHPFSGEKRTRDFEDTQASLKMRDYLMEIAAKHRLVLEFHGCTLPSGERRRYPHFMTAEGVAGMEKRNPKIENELTIPYVRNIMGPVSFTVIKFDRSLGSHAYQMAQTVVYEAGIQIYAERHDRLLAFPGVEFLKKAPSAWDETRFIDGYPGTHAIFARRKGTDWYVGGMTDAPRTARIPLHFLDGNASYQARIYRDGPTPTNLVTEVRTLIQGDTLEIPMLERGGFAVRMQVEK